MNYKEKVKKNNPVVYSILNNAIKTGKLHHSYIFAADTGVQIKDEPLFLIQTLISEDGKNNNPLKYPDLFVIKGKNGVIKKEDVVNTIETLNETSLDDRGYKFVMIENIEQANVQSLNSLLKFIEEPTPNTYFLITTNNVQSLLPTIQSRSQVLKVNNASKENLIEELLEEGIAKKFAYILANISESKKEALKIYSKDFKDNYNILVETMKSAINSKSYIFVNLSPVINKRDYLPFMLMFREFVSDIWKVTENQPISFINEEELLKRYSLAQFNFPKALTAISDFILKQRYHVNFDLYKSKLLMEIMECYE